MLNCGIGNFYLLQMFTNWLSDTANIPRLTFETFYGSIGLIVLAISAYALGILTIKLAFYFPDFWKEDAAFWQKQAKAYQIISAKNADNLANINKLYDTAITDIDKIGDNYMQCIDERSKLLDKLLVLGNLIKVIGEKFPVLQYDPDVKELLKQFIED